jgi:hypothetical protein
MSSIPLNIFQKLMRRWDAVHPYNAAQVMKLTGPMDAAAWKNAWRTTLAISGLGSVHLDQKHYQFISLNGHADAYPVRFPQTALDEFISAEINRPFDDPYEPPFRPFVISAGDHFYAGMTYQHWLADSASIRMLMQQWFLRVYHPAQAESKKLPLARNGYWDTIGPRHGGWGVMQSLLDMTRRHVRLRKVQKIDSAELANHDTRFELMPALPGLITDIRQAAHRRHVKVNDIILAALAEACAQHVPLQRRRNRRDVAVGSVVDLRPFAPKRLAGDFGLFLGFTNVICQPQDLRNFDALLKAVAAQTRHQKASGVAPASLMWMGAAMFVGSLSKPHELYHFYRKELPLAGGSSNVDLSRTWVAHHHPAPLLDYIRISPTGPMTPLAVTTTTLADQFHLGITHRTGLIPPERAHAIGKQVLDRLESLRQV